MVTGLFFIVLLLHPFHQVARCAHTEPDERDLARYIDLLIDRREQWITVGSDGSIVFRRFRKIGHQSGKNPLSDEQYVNFLVAEAIPKDVQGFSSVLWADPTDDMSQTYLDFCLEMLVNVYTVALQVSEKMNKEVESSKVPKSFKRLNNQLDWWVTQYENRLKMYANKRGKDVYAEIFDDSADFLSPWDDPVSNYACRKHPCHPEVIENVLVAERERILEREELFKSDLSLIPSKSVALLLLKNGPQWCKDGSRLAHVPQPFLSAPGNAKHWEGLASAKVQLLQQILFHYLAQSNELGERWQNYANNMFEGAARMSKELEDLFKDDWNEARPLARLAHEFSKRFTRPERESSITDSSSQSGSSGPTSPVNPGSQSIGDCGPSSPVDPGSQSIDDFGATSSMYPDNQYIGDFGTTSPMYPGNQYIGDFGTTSSMYPDSQYIGDFGTTSPMYPGNQYIGDFGTRSPVDPGSQSIDGSETGSPQSWGWINNFVG
ncbi:hypothetical protein SeLEV6574_g03043 [Synchytrium endobioticum]|uniref:Uncharacterized protein n=1 Tax=Synchytrium endobioticum TaxID=286115 RepID=A0A507D699_9FUNG|nr:hypothetical protein SeLEV6574_g03048 [Synchytrium endobioticum]TPX46761.1 hypothetical protein SeLEV6574_g03043 [Synchytrium endobioticum]